MNLLPANFDNYNIALNNTEIQIFFLSVNEHAKKLPAYKKILQPEELSRASRFFKSQDQERYIVGRGVLKQLSALYIDSASELICIVSDENKKPVLKDYRHLHFNISHSKDCIVFAFSHSPTGIDIEYLNDDFNYKPIARHCFTCNENYLIGKSNTPVKEFFKLWTRKEALLKANGKGLSDDMNKIDCLNEACVSEIMALGYENYRMESFEIDKDYIGSTAYNGSKKKLKFCRI